MLSEYLGSMAAAGLHRLSFALSLNRQILIQGISRLQPAAHHFSVRVTRRAFNVRAGATKGSAADDFLAKVHDKDLVKTAGFVNGQWVAATDGSTIEVSPSSNLTHQHALILHLTAQGGASHPQSGYNCASDDTPSLHTPC